MLARNGYWVLFFCLAVTGCVSSLAPKPEASEAALRDGAYVLDRSHASIVFKIDHLGFSNYVGRFEELEATLDFNEGSPEGAIIDAVIDIASLNVANDAFAQTLLGPQWFDAGSFPTATFRSRTIEVTGPDEGRMTGELTLKGVSKEVSFEVTFNGGDRDLLRGAYVVGFSAVGQIDRTLFGIDRFAGTIANTVTLEIEAEFLKQK